MEYISEKLTDWNASKVALISPDGASGGDGGVGWLERVIPLCPTSPDLYFPSNIDGTLICSDPSADLTWLRRSDGIRATLRRLL
jgi:hypothetical protein